MVALNKIDSNVTGLRYAEEASIGVLPASPVWLPAEPNSYDDFGGQTTLVARNPINPSRQRKKGVIVDLDANGGYPTDITQDNMQNLLQGFFFADLREKASETVTAVDIDAGNPDEFEVADTTGFAVGDLIKGSNFLNATNNGFFPVTVVTSNTSVEVADGSLVAEAAPPANATITKVGVVGTAGDIDVDASGSLPALTSTTLDFTTLGLIPGEWIYVGGDVATTAFTTAANNGFKRVRSITANRLEMDKSNLAMVTEASTSETIHIYIGRVIKNELGSLIKRRSYQFERTLGAPESTQPAQVQAEYLEGVIPSTLTFNIPQASILTANLGFVGIDATTIDGPTALKSGNRPPLIDADAFNTSSDFSRIRLAQVIPGNEAPVPLFVYAQELTITINNNLTANKAVGRLGAFDVTAGTFEVGGSITAYFANVAAINAVRNNVDVTLDMAVVKDNAGMVLDLPLIALGGGRPNVTQDQAISIPLEMSAATGAKLSTDLDHTALMVFFDYLPTAAG